MKIDKEVQYGMLICLYIQRAGRAHLDDLNDGLGVYKGDLMRSAQVLIDAGVLSEPATLEFELIGDPTVKQVFQAFGALDLVSQSEKDMLSTGCHEFRALNNCFKGLKQSMNPVLNRKISNINKELVVNELQQIEKAKDSGWMN